MIKEFEGYRVIIENLVINGDVDGILELMAIREQEVIEEMSNE